MKSGKGFYKPLFSHIYIEESIEGRDSVLRIIKRFPSAVIIRIKHYKDVFNKPSQNPGMQMNSQKLILAENKGRRIFPGAPYCHDFGHRSFYYTSQVQNCPFDCSYCYLKGKYPTANIVVFVNTEDYFRDILAAAGDAPAFITLSYDSDMNALEPLLNLE
ncbi:MAG: radical SAM protein, partial [Clostridia bacterium]|nr:radical SAM protein [Clostridia bacterium]